MTTAKGFRQSAQPSKKAAVNQLGAEMAQIQTAQRITQMMVQQLMQTIKGLTQDLNGSLNKTMELEYKVGALQKALNVDAKTLEDISNGQRLKDFDEAAAKANVADKLVAGTTINENSVITITSTALDASGNDVGIFRSRLTLAETGLPDMVTALTGKSVGDKVSVAINGSTHEIEVLSINDAQPQVEAATEVTAQH